MTRKKLAVVAVIAVAVIVAVLALRPDPPLEITETSPGVFQLEGGTSLERIRESNRVCGARNAAVDMTQSGIATVECL